VTTVHKSAFSRKIQNFHFLQKKSMKNALKIHCCSLFTFPDFLFLIFFCRKWNFQIVLGKFQIMNSVQQCFLMNFPYFSGKFILPENEFFRVFENFQIMNSSHSVFLMKFPDFSEDFFAKNEFFSFSVKTPYYEQCCEQWYGQNHATSSQNRVWLRQKLFRTKLTRY
jgi:hypothetical protein